MQFEAVELSTNRHGRHTFVPTTCSTNPPLVYKCITPSMGRSSMQRGLELVRPWRLSSLNGTWAYQRQGTLCCPSEHQFSFLAFERSEDQSVCWFTSSSGYTNETSRLTSVDEDLPGTIHTPGHLQHYSAPTLDPHQEQDDNKLSLLPVPEAVLDCAPLSLAVLTEDLGTTSDRTFCKRINYQERSF